MNPIRATLCLLLAIPAFASAQYMASNNKTAGPNLAIDNTAAATQVWVKEEDQVNGRINPARMTRMRSMTESIINNFRDSLIANDQYAALWHGEYYSEKMSPGPQMKFAAICNFVEQHASLQVVANDISPLMDHVVLNNTDFLTIRPATSIKNGASYFEYYSANGELNKTWMLTASKDGLPFTSVTRKEYLTLAHTELANLKKDIMAELQQKMPVRSEAVQEAEKKAELERLKNMYSGSDLEIHTRTFLQHYKTDKEYLEASFKHETLEIDSTMHYMEALLHRMPAVELERPAVVSGAAVDFRGWEDGHGGKMLIRMNGAWANGGVAVEKPRLFLVTLTYDAEDGLAAGLDRLVNDRLDLQVLQNMIEQ